MSNMIYAFGKIIGEKIQIICPYCAKTHWHGIPDGLQADEYRVPHCEDNETKEDYILKEYPL